MRFTRDVAVLLLLVLLVQTAAPSVRAQTSEPSSDLNTGPYIDSVIYEETRYRSDELLSGEIDIIGSLFYSIAYELVELASDPDISFAAIPRNGYRSIQINCAKYPLNISGFRRAFAFAYNKTLVAEDVWNSLFGPHDSLVPMASSWCAEDQLPWDYYDAQPELGNSILDSLGFSINPETGYRLTPNGTEFEVCIETAYYGVEPSLALTTAVESLESLHVKAYLKVVDIVVRLEEIADHQDYDMILTYPVFENDGVQWLADEYFSDNANVSGRNPSNFMNASFDSWRNQLLFGATYDDVLEASNAMQRILHENVPRLVVSTSGFVGAYRNDVFEGHVDGLSQSASDPWTLRKIRRVEGPLGGTVTVGVDVVPSTFNFFVAEASQTPLPYTGSWLPALWPDLWPSLFALGPNHHPVPYLATDVLIETHNENSAVPLGHERFTLNLIENASWSDGTPLTGQDVVFTFVYLIESSYYGNPAGAGLDELVSVYSPSPETVVFEFSTESYWHFDTFAYTRVIPCHIFNDEDGIGYAGWETWDPVFKGSHPHVTCGPFLVESFTDGVSLELAANPSFPFSLTSGTSTTSTGSTTTSTTGDEGSILLVGLGGAAGLGAVVVVYIFTKYIRVQRRSRP